MNKRQSTGQWGEATAARYLVQKGYQIIERNVRTPYGEIDIVARQDQAVVFVEVKTRTSRKFGAPEVSVSARKQAHMIACAESYRQSHPLLDGEWRIDVIAIERQVDTSPRIVHFENAI